MLRHTLAILVLLLYLLPLHAQVADTLDQEARPRNGVHQLAIQYYGIEFTKEQRKEIKGVEIEFIFSIDEFGKPTLAEVNGVQNQDIVDSLRNKTMEVAPFYPQIQDGQAVPSIYFMKLTYPSYTYRPPSYEYMQGQVYNEAKLDDFEYIHESGRRFDMVIGGLVNQFIGSPAKHLNFGGGMKLDLGYAGKNKLIYGINMSIYSNKLKKDYPINSTREQLNAPPLVLVGLVFGKWFDKFSVQAEVNAGSQNITEKRTEDDPDWIQLKGWSPGLVVNYPIQLGANSPVYYYGSPTLINNSLNLHLGLRYVKLSLEEASGFMAEFGVSYRLSIRSVNEYKLKHSFLSR